MKTCVMRIMLLCYFNIPVKDESENESGDDENSKKKSTFERRQEEVSNKK